MIEQQGLFKKYFVGRDGFYWWIGQIAPSRTWKYNIPAYPVTNNGSIAGFGERYKVRIMGHHTANKNELPDESLPWATVMYPVTAGGGPKGSYQSANLTQGTFVFGFFMDGEDAQQPVIMGAIGYNDYNQVMSGIPETGFIPFTGYEPGESVSVTAVPANNGGGETAPLSSTGGRSDVSGTRIESTNGSTTNITQADTDARRDGVLEVPLKSPDKCKKNDSELQRILKKAIQDIENSKKSLYKWQYNIAEKAAKKEEEITKKITKAYEDVMKWLKKRLEDAQKAVSDFINKKSKQFNNLLFPNEQEKLKKAKEENDDLIICFFKKIFANIGQFVLDFLSGVANKIINVASCLVNNFIGGILGQLAGLLDSLIKQAFGKFNQLVGGAVSLGAEALGIAGAALAIVLRAFNILSCDEKPSCPKIDSWSIWGGTTQLFGPSGDVDDLIGRITSFSGKVTDTIEAAIDIDNIKNLFDINVDDLFDLSGCFTGPRACGPPTLQIFGDGAGAAVNLIVSQGGSVIGADVVNAGIGYIADAITGKVYDDCGKGSGAVIEIITGPVVVIDGGVGTGTGTGIDPTTGLPTTTDPTGTISPGTVTTGVTGIRVIDGGIGYIPSPDGSLGGDGRTWAENNETIVQHSNGDYEIPIPPGNQICVVAGDIVTLPVGSSVTTEPNSGVGGNELILGGKPHTMQRSGCFTSPEVDFVKLSSLYPANAYPTDSTGAYPVILYLCDISIENSGINYKSTDRIIIEPSNGAEATFTLGSLGEVIDIKVTNGGEGFTELPEVYIETDTGLNAVLSPRLCIDRIGNNVDKPITGDLVSVVDCVGKF